MREDRTIGDVEDLIDIVRNLLGLAVEQRIVKTTHNGIKLTALIGPSKADTTLVPAVLIKERSLYDVEKKQTAANMTKLNEMTRSASLTSNDIGFNTEIAKIMAARVNTISLDEFAVVEPDDLAVVGT